MKKTGLLFVVSAPAGAGKTTLVERLVREVPAVERSISFTTRKPRGSEVSGKDYHFIDQNLFEEKQKKGDFLESAQVFDHLYGTSKEETEKRLRRGIHVFLVIDTQGAMSLKGKVDATFIFILPPDEETLRKRLLCRGTDNESQIEKRLSWAKKEMEKAPFYDYTIINDDLEEAFDALRSICIAEEHRNR